MNNLLIKMSNKTVMIHRLHGPGVSFLDATHILYPKRTYKFVIHFDKKFSGEIEITTTIIPFSDKESPMVINGAFNCMLTKEFNHYKFKVRQESTAFINIKSHIWMG